MQQSPGPRGSQWTIKLPSSDCYAYPGGGPRVVAVTDAELWAVQQHGHAARRGGGDRGSSSQEPHHQQRHKHRPASGSANAVMAGAYYPAAMHPTGGPAVMGPFHWQHRGEDPYLRGPVGEPFVFHQVMPQVWSFVPWRFQRQKMPFASARQMAVMCADEPGGGHQSGDQAAGYQQQQNQNILQPYHHQHGWEQDDGDDYEGEGSGNNGQGDGDGPSQFGGGEDGAAEDAAVLLEEQDQVVALLVAIDARHEKQLAFERVLQERYSTAWWRRRSRQRYHLRSATSTESLDVIVKAALWRCVSDKCIYDSVNSESWYSPVPYRPRALSLCERENDEAATCCSPTVTLNLEGIVGASSSLSHVEDDEANEPVVVISGADAADTVNDTGHLKEAADMVGAKEKTWLFTTPPQVQPKQSAGPQSAHEHPPQRQDVPAAMTGHQQRRLPEYRRSYTRREYHSTRRYESDHMPPPPPPPPPQERAPPGCGRQVRNELPPQQNGRCRDIRPINQHDLSYAKGQQEHRAGHSDSRNRNRSNRHGNGHNQWGRNNPRMDALDVGNRGGGQRSSLPYCCRKVAGAPGVANPVNSPPPPPQPRGRHYNRQKEGMQQAQGHYRSGRQSPQRGAAGNREAMSGSSSRAPAAANSARPPAHQRAVAAADANPSSGRNRRPPRPDINHPRVGAAGETADGPATKTCESNLSSRGDGDAALSAITDYEPPAEADQRRSGKELWERSTPSRRRPSQ